LSGVNALKNVICAASAFLCLASCGQNDAETEAEVNFNGFVPMKAGLWETKFLFRDIDLPTLGKGQRREIMEEMAKSGSGRTCLSAASGAQPEAKFFGGKGTENCAYKNFDVSGPNVNMQLSCGMEGMGTADIELSGPMGDTAFKYESEVAVRLPMIGKVKLRGDALGTYVGPCPAA
jgi:Protein of unknown function (DUF3617)